MVVSQKEFVVLLDNVPGSLAGVATALGKDHVDVHGFLAQTQGEFGVLRLVTSDAVKTERWLRQAHHRFRTREVIGVPIDNHPGDLGRVASRLGASGVNIEAAYPSVERGRVFLTLAVDDVHAAKKALGA